MPFTYDYECQRCNHVFEETRAMNDRDDPTICPKCLAGIGKRIITKVSFSTQIPGFYAYDSKVEASVQESVRAQKEGFRSQMEMDVAMEQAHDRAKQLGVPVERIIGGHKSPFKGPAFKPEASDARTAEELAKGVLKAAGSGDQKKLRDAKIAQKQFEQTLKKKAASHKREFKPDKSKEQLQKEVKKAQQERKGVGI